MAGVVPPSAIAFLEHDETPVGKVGNRFGPEVVGPLGKNGDVYKGMPCARLSKRARPAMFI